LVLECDEASRDPEVGLRLPGEAASLPGEPWVDAGERSSIPNL